MGIIYKETVCYKKLSFIRGILLLFLFIQTVNLVLNSQHYSSKYNIAIETLIFADGMLAIIILKVIFDLVYSHRISYMYKLIDRDLIFEKTVGNSGKVILCVDTKHIELIMPAAKAKKIKDVDKTYKFLCGHCNNNIYGCVFDDNGQKVRFYFQPSDELKRKLMLIMENGPKVELVS